MNTTEISIPVPWGTIAGKVWNKMEGDVALVLHGLQDSAGSFDRLIPLLTKRCYICIDFPGCGKSSKLPGNTPFTLMDYVYALKLVTNYLKRDSYILIGHSLGGQINTLYAQFYPEEVKLLIVLDTVYMRVLQPHQFKYYFVNNYEKEMEIYEKTSNKSPPVYTREEAIEKVMTTRPFYVTREAATALIERSLIPDGKGKYYISTDQRLKSCVTPPFSRDYVVAALKCDPVRCPHLIVLGSKAEYFLRQMYETIIEEMQKNPSFEIIGIEGDHDVHNNNPERVAPLINRFIAKHVNSKL